MWIGETSQAVEQLLKLVDQTELPITVEVPVLLLVCEAFELEGRRFDSIIHRRRLAQVVPQHLDNLFQISLLLVGVGEIDEAISYCRRLLELNPDHRGAAANYLLYLNYSDGHSTAEIAKEHFRLGMRLSERAERVDKRVRTINERIRIGYLASDFYTHPVGKLMLPILQSHDREQFDIRVFHGGKKSDALTQAISATVDELTVIHQWSDDRVVETIRAQGIDVLVDLGGYTGGGNRLRALSRRVAPVQASFLGYPNTSALPTIDFHLTDRLADPPGLADRMYGERLVWLRHSHVAWRPYGIAAEIIASPSPCPMLGVFNNVAKISLRAISTYAEILRRVPEAKIVFKYGDRFGVRVLQDRYRREFASHGVLPDRLEFRSRSETLKGHLQTMANVDLALDSFPYQGTMTSLECLSVGTPTLSCCGDFYAHRATSAMMIRMGIQELVAETAAEYSEIAVELLHHMDDLRALREQVRESFYASALADPAGLVRELESIYSNWASLDERGRM